MAEELQNVAEKLKQPDPDIVYQGKAITLPEDPTKMGLRAAADALIRKAEDEEQVMSVHEVINAHPHDALVAFNWAMKETYGWSSPKPKMTFFGPKPPEMITVATGPKDHEYMQLPCGVFQLPNVRENLEIALDFRSNCMHVVSKCRKGDKQVIMDLINMAKARLKSHSIFKGKAVRIPCDEDGEAMFQAIQFLETDYIKPEELILNDDEWDHVQASLWTPIQKTADCLKHRIPLNRGILLEGPFGTGKTMTANVTSKICVDNDWTYFLLDDIRDLKRALLFAQAYQPCVIFAEDIDRVVGERDERGNDILNTIDGILTKNSKVITVLTTNFVEKLDRAMLRPGRLDAVISVRVPEPEAVKRLIRLYGADLVDQNDSLEEAAQVLAGNIPASIREAVERSKLAMIGRGGDKVSDHDLVVAANGMATHMALLNSEKPAETKEHQAGRALRELLTGSGGLQEIKQAASNVAKHARASANSIQSSANKIASAVEEGAEMTGDKLDSVKKDTAVIRKAVS